MANRSIFIQDAHNIVKELVVFNTVPTQYAIKRPGMYGGHYYQMISEQKFLAIIHTAIANGFDVFDYTTF